MNIGSQHYPHTFSHWGDMTQEKLSPSKWWPVIMYDANYLKENGFQGSWDSERSRKGHSRLGEQQRVQSDTVLTDVPGTFVYGYRPYMA